MNPCSRASRGVRITVVRTVVGVRPRSSNAFRTSLAAAISFGQSGTTSSSTSTPVIFGSVPKCRIRSWQRRIARFPASTATVRASARVRPSGELPPPPLLGRSALRGGDYPDVQRHRLGVAVEVGGVALEGERDGGETLLLRLSLGSRSATIDMKRGYPEMPVLGFVIASSKKNSARSALTARSSSCRATRSLMTKAALSVRTTRRGWCSRPCRFVHHVVAGRAQESPESAI